MTTWLFQGNPDVFDMDHYFALTRNVVWSVRQAHLADQMRPGDRVFFWRAAGRGNAASGVVATGTLTEEPYEGSDDDLGLQLWDNPEDALATRLRVRAELHGKPSRRLLPREVVQSDPALGNLRILTMANQTNYRVTTDQAARLEELWAASLPEVPTSWLLIAFDEDQRQHGGNVGYDDDVERVYRYDSLVPNSKQISEGDVAVLRSDALLGFARIMRLETEAGLKDLNRCPNCTKTTIKARKTVLPKYRCHSCKTEFDEPVVDQAEVTKFRAFFDGTFVAAPRAVPLKELADACLKYNGNLAMQRLDLAAVVAKAKQAHPEVERFLDFRGTTNNRASDDPALAQEAAAADAEGAFEPTSIEDAKRRRFRAIAVRQGQPQFRQALLSAYRGCCCISGYDAEAALEAAHIVPYRGERTNRVQNGLLLRADLHTLFDRGLLAIDTNDMTVLVHEDLDGTRYADLRGAELRLPDEPSRRPSKQALDAHHELWGW